MSKQHILIFPTVSFQQVENPMVSRSDIVCILTRLLSHQIFASLINLSSDIFSNQIFLSIFKQDSGHFPSLSPCLLEANDMPFRLIRLKQWTNKTSSFSCRAITKWFCNLIQNNKDHYFNYILRFCWCPISHLTICDRYASTLAKTRISAEYTILTVQEWISRLMEFPTLLQTSSKGLSHLTVPSIQQAKYTSAMARMASNTAENIH